MQTEFKSTLAESGYQRLKERKPLSTTHLRLETLEWEDIHAKKMWRLTVFGVVAAFFRQFSGINAFVYYAPTLFEPIGQGEEMATTLSGVFNCLQLVSVFICFVVIDRVGRRLLAMFGAFGCCICYTIIAILSGLFEKD